LAGTKAVESAAILLIPKTFFLMKIIHRISASGLRKE
jgi:hypothetical protein